MPEISAGHSTNNAREVDASRVFLWPSQCQRKHRRHAVIRVVRNSSIALAIAMNTSAMLSAGVQMRIAVTATRAVTDPSGHEHAFASSSVTAVCVRSVCVPAT